MDPLPVRHLTRLRQVVMAAGVLLALLGWSSVRAQESAPIVVKRVYFASQAQLDRLAALADIWEVNQADGYALTPLTEAAERSLARAGYVVTVDPARTEQARALGSELAAADGVVGYPCYRTVEETYADLADLAARHPGLARWIDIGDSWLKTQNPAQGYDLHALVLSNQASAAPKATLLLLAAVHAREMATAELATRFAELLLEEYGRSPEVTWLLDHTEIHIVPVGNPDGRKEAEKGVLWRKTVATGDGCVADNPPFAYAGVDLNRNSSYRWNACGDGSCSSGQACSETYRGPAAASEPEAQALEAYLRAIFQDQRDPADGDAAPQTATGLFISLHSYSELVLFPWGWKAEIAPNGPQLQTLGRKFGYFNGYAVCQLSQSGCLYRADGTHDDFVYGELGVAAYTFELGDFFFEQCFSFEEEVVPDNLPALLFAAKAARQPYAAPAGPEVTRLATVPMAIAPGTEFPVEVTVDDTRFASNGFGDEPVQAIASVRYSVDAPSWLTATVTATITPSVTPALSSIATAPAAPAVAPLDGLEARSALVTGTFTVSTEALPVGRHLLYVEGQDSAGNWGVPTAQFIDISAGERSVAIAGPAAVVAAADTRLTLTATVTNTGQVAAEYAVRVTDSPWSLVLSSPVVFLEPGARADIAATVAVPRGAAPGLETRIVLTVASPVEPWVEALLPIDVTVASQRRYLPIAGR